MKKSGVSITTKLSLIFFALILFNALLFWVISGSNQMKLIARNGTLEALAMVFRLRESIAQTIPVSGAVSNLAQIRSMLPPEKWAKITADKPFTVFSTENHILFSNEGQKPADIPPEWREAALKAIQLREFRNEIFYGIPEISTYSIEVFMPVLNARDGDILIHSTFSIPSMKSELAALMRFAIMMIAILLGVQGLVAFLIYRILIRPIVTLTTAVYGISGGEFVQVNDYTSRSDEIGLLISSFNKMSIDIRDQKREIQNNYLQIKKASDKMQFELGIAQKIQASILNTTNTAKLRSVAREYAPLYGVSGDYYDIFNLPDDTLGIIIADASGHGVPAALLTIMAKIYFSSLSDKIPEPHALLQAVNTSISQSLEGGGYYLTACYFRLYADGGLEYCNGIHPSPIVWHKDERRVEKLPSSGFYLGLMEEVPYPFETKKASVKSGDRLILYTDGITEAANESGDMFGEDRLVAVVAEFADESTENLKQKILSEMKAFCGDAPIRDDVTLLVIEFGDFAEKVTPAEITRAIKMYREQNFQQAIQIFEDIDRQGFDATGLPTLYFADAYFKLRMYSEALPLFERYLNHIGHNEVVALKAGLCLARLNRHQDALNHFDAALQNRPDLAEAHARRAISAFRLHMHEEALQSAQTALGLRPGDIRFQNIHKMVSRHPAAALAYDK